MSRSVSAPSSVTKTSPCWKGLRVPGSTFRYGSNFCRLTRSPRLSSRQPIDDAAIPLPREETTPPVTKMYLAILNHPRQRHLKQFRHPCQILRCIHADGFVFCFNHAYLVPVFQGTQLLQLLGSFERPHRQSWISQQKIPPIDIQANMFV